MQINIELKGLSKVRNTLNHIEGKAKNTAPLMAELSNHLYNTIERSFQNQESPDGKSWNPIKFRKSDQNPNKILYDKGDMQDTVYHESGSDFAKVGLNATSNGYPYPAVHQFGTIDGKIDARPFMPIHLDGSMYKNVEDELKEIIEDYMQL